MRSRLKNKFHSLNKLKRINTVVHLLLPQGTQAFENILIIYLTYKLLISLPLYYSKTLTKLHTI